MPASSTPGQTGADLIPSTTYDYWLEDVAVSGEVTRHGPVCATVQAPTAVTLSSLNASAGAVAGLPSLLVAAGVGLTLGLSRLRWRT